MNSVDEPKVTSLLSCSLGNCTKLSYLQMVPRFKASATFQLTDGSSLLYSIKFEGYELKTVGKFASVVFTLCFYWLSLMIYFVLIGYCS